MTRLTVFIFLLLTFTQCRRADTSTQQYGKVAGELADHAMVVSAREEASRIGADIIKSGGNAFDAMIATEMALAVCFPYAGNLAGGGFMVYRLDDGTVGSLDYREKAPLAAHKDMYLDEEGNVIPGLSYTGALAVGVPGTVAGIFAVHEKYGTMPMEEILKPVIDLARKGFKVTESQTEMWKYFKKQFNEVNRKSIALSDDLSAGEVFTNEALASTLERISRNGREEFYGKGETAEVMLAFLKGHNGIITNEDLANYEAIWRKPVQFSYDDLKITGMAPPSSGGMTLLQIMNMIQPYDLEKMGHNSPDYLSHVVEAERRAYADRNYYLGDPDFVDIPVDELTSADYLSKRMASFDDTKATPSSELARGEVNNIYESNETTHYSIVDNQGNAVAVTTTLNGAYGSKLYVDDLGFFLNNEMDDFSAKPGVPNAYGLVGAEANAVAPGKRMLSSMTPTIVEKDGALWMVVGTPGGSTIITSVLQTILNVHEFNMTMQEAVNAPRFHHQWLPDEIRIESDVLDAEDKRVLEHKGYHFNENSAPIIGKVDAILIRQDGKLEGGADRRGDDTAVGF